MFWLKHNLEKIRAQDDTADHDAGPREPNRHLARIGTKLVEDEMPVQGGGDHIPSGKPTVDPLGKKQEHDCDKVCDHARAECDCVLRRVATLFLRGRRRV